MSEEFKPAPHKQHFLETILDCCLIYQLGAAVEADAKDVAEAIRLRAIQGKAKAKMPKEVAALSLFAKNPLLAAENTSKSKLSVIIEFFEKLEKQPC